VTRVRADCRSLELLAMGYGRKDDSLTVGEATKSTEATGVVESSAFLGLLAGSREATRGIKTGSITEARRISSEPDVDLLQERCHKQT
jgi:hypothetical protein